MPSTPPLALSTNYAFNAPAAQNKIRASNLDSDNSALNAWASALLEGLGVTLRDDDTLADAVVRSRNLHPEVAALIASAAGWQPKADVQAASALGVNINLAAPGTTIDSRILQANDRFLAKDQTVPAECGIYVWNGASVPAIRATDSDSATKLGHAFVTVAASVLAGGLSAQAGTSWVCNQSAADIASLGTAGITFGQVGGQFSPSAAMVPVVTAATLPLARAAMGPWGDAVVTANNSPTARSLGIRFRDRISVRDFGAVGDGTTDDTAAIQAAINYVTSTYDPATYASNSPYNGPCALFFPAGQYLISDTLVITKKIAIEGEGQSEFSSGARIQQNTTNKDIFRINPIAQGMSFSIERMTLKAGIGGTGHLINITRTTSTCNSVRILDCTFGTPQTFSINIQAGDDIRIDGCLFDASANYAIGLGTATAADAVSNCEITGCGFYSILTRVILLYNVDGVIIAKNRVYGAAGGTDYFIDALNSAPYQIKNLIVADNILKAVDCIFAGDDVVGACIKGNQGSNCGNGASSVLGAFYFTGTNTDIVIDGNEIVGNWDAKNAYNDAGGSVTGRISNNHFRATGGTGQAINCPNFNGQIRDNNLPGWGGISLSHRNNTSGNAMAPGVIAGGAKSDLTLTVNGARQGDFIKTGAISTAWFSTIGVEVEAFVSAPNTVMVSYRNVTSGAIGVPPHDISYEVER